MLFDALEILLEYDDSDDDAMEIWYGLFERLAK